MANAPAVSQRTESKRRGRKTQSNRAGEQRTGLDGCGASAGRPACRAQAATHRAQPPNKCLGREPPTPTASPFSGRQLPCRLLFLFWGRSFFSPLVFSVRFLAGTWRNQVRIDKVSHVQRLPCLPSARLSLPGAGGTNGIASYVTQPHSPEENLFSFFLER